MINVFPEVITEIYKDLAQPSVHKMGLALGTVFEFSYTFLLPLKLKNEKAKLNFQKNINEYKSKIEKIPEEKICEVNPQIGVPILERLTYTTNEELVDLFTSLLAKASDTDNVNLAHPGFIHVMESLSVDEARIVKFLSNGQDIPFITLKLYQHNGHFNILEKNLNILRQKINFNFPQNIGTYLDNFLRLGILEKTNFAAADPTIYEDILEANNFSVREKALLALPQYREVQKKNSLFIVTDYGTQFIKSVKA